MCVLSFSAQSYDGDHEKAAAARHPCGEPFWVVTLRCSEANASHCTTRHGFCCIALHPLFRSCLFFVWLCTLFSPTSLVYHLSTPCVVHVVVRGVELSWSQVTVEIFVNANLWCALEHSQLSCESTSNMFCVVGSVRVISRKIIECCIQVALKCSFVFACICVCVMCLSLQCEPTVLKNSRVFVDFWPSSGGHSRKSFEGHLKGCLTLFSWNGMRVTVSAQCRPCAALIPRFLPFSSPSRLSYFREGRTARLADGCVRFWKPSLRRWYEEFFLPLWWITCVVELAWSLYLSKPRSRELCSCLTLLRWTRYVWWPATSITEFCEFVQKV